MIFKKSPEDKARKMFFTNLDRIYTTSKDICNLWKTETLPLTSLKEIIKLSKPETKGVTDKNALTLLTQFNSTLDQLYISCEKAAKKMNSKNVPLAVIKQGIDMIKTAFNKGMKGVA
jgi:hypothetical protein